MGIVFNEAEKIFHLQTGNTSYVMQIYKSGYLAHAYFGRKIRSSNLNYIIRTKCRAFAAYNDNRDKDFSLETIPQEYPSYGSTDLRAPGYQVQYENGTTISDLKYLSHAIIKGKPAIDGLPSTYVEEENEAETLEITMLDKVSNLKAILTYTVFENINAITRSVRFINEDKNSVNLRSALSACIDFEHSDFDMLQLSGSWARERHIFRRPLFPGIQGVDSKRGASSHQQNPFIALLSKDATETNGEAYGFSIVYSGNFTAQVEVDQFNTSRVLLGINPFDFNWLLESGEAFQTPEVVMVYSSNGIGEMSRTYHKLYRSRLCRGQYRDKARPVLINNWEATYFDFNAEKIKAIAKTAKEVGIDLFVLDDGWFGKRNADDSSLGDWFVDKNKLPEGLDALSKDINCMGLQFGLWFEPEMISPESELYKAHPDWCIHVPERHRSESRSQLILDFSRKDVCDEIIKRVSDVLKSAKISYVKWDMNRHMSEIGSGMLSKERQRETAHRYMLGLYRVMGEITGAFQNVLFESCSGGGGRFDPGILYYMPQTWTSDDTDAVERLKIQYGTSIVYPISSMGCHVSAVPNHQVGRITPLEMRGHVAMSGNFGYELDLNKLEEVEKTIIKKQIALYKDVRDLIQFGEFYRLQSPFTGNETSWMFVSEDKSEAFVAHFRVMRQPNPPLSRVKLQGLNPDYVYEIISEVADGVKSTFGGDELMYIGLDTSDQVFNGQDYMSTVWKLKKQA